MTFIEFYALAFNPRLSVIAFTYITEEPHKYSGWISRPMDCKKLVEGLRFSANGHEYRRSGLTIQKIN